jgi:predicted lipoprotein
MKKLFPFLVLLVLTGSCGKNKFKRSDFLQDFYTHKIWPDFLETESRVNDLQATIDAFNLNPDATNFGLVRDAFKTTLTCFEKIAFYNIGDINAISVYNAAYKTSVDTAEIWSNYTNASVFTADQVSTYGNKEKGIYTIEYLLFFEHATDSINVARYRSCLAAQVETLADNFAQIKTSWSVYESNFVSKSDEGVEGSYNIVINRIVHLLEDLIAKRINVPLDAADEKLAVGYWSSAAWTNIKTQVSQLHAIYMGNGDSEFNSVYNSVHKKNRKLANEIESKFKSLADAGSAMNEGMQYYVTTGSAELVQYKETLKELLVLFKLDVVKELDIVLTFGDNDGD